jgi:hypothetical protein
MGKAQHASLLIDNQIRPRLAPMQRTNEEPQAVKGLAQHINKNLFILFKNINKKFLKNYSNYIINKTYLPSKNTQQAPSSCSPEFTKSYNSHQY